MNKPVYDRTITLPIGEYLVDFLGSFDRKQTTIAKAQLIKSIDDSDFFVHVQMHELDDKATPLTEPVIWWIKDWNTYYLNWKFKKEKFARDRKEANLVTENTSRLMRAMCREAGLPPEDVEMFRKLAEKISIKKDDRGAETFKVKLDKG